MQPILSLVLLGITTAFAIPSDSQQQVPFSFVLTVADKEVTAGGEVTVELTIKNTSGHTIGLEGMEVSPYVAIVRGSDGILTPETERGRVIKQKQRERMSPNWTGGRVGYDLQPGESESKKCTVSELYDMSKPGEYLIQFERIWGRRVVLSNTVRVKVIPQSQ